VRGPDNAVWLAPEPRFAEIGVGDGATYLVVALTPIERRLHVLAQGRRVNEVEQVETLQDSASCAPYHTPHDRTRWSR